MKLHITNRTATELEDSACGSCGGTGFYDDYDFERSRPVKCPVCHGTGIEA